VQRCVRRFAPGRRLHRRAAAGNPLAVVHDAEGLDDATMAAFARWTNLSETTFLLPPTDPAADYRVRIFTPGGELPFAGHPTLGSCHAWLAAGGVPRDAGEVVQQCGVGLVRMRRASRHGQRWPSPRRRCAAPGRWSPRCWPAGGARRWAWPMPRCCGQWVDNGPGWCAVMLLADAATVLALQPDFAAWAILKLGVVGAAGRPARHRSSRCAPSCPAWACPKTRSPAA
jgi:predicted PhzF superfamily epimerase YddE/YHI9